MEIIFTVSTFEALSPSELYEIMALRQEVFVVEQHCPYLDADGLDPRALHVSGRDREGRLVAYARVFGPGIKYPESSVGRVCSALSARRTGLGRSVVHHAIEVVKTHFGNVPIHISAQAYLEQFYCSFGFEPLNERYLEDDIPHVAMVRAGELPLS
jgi:ElaA protein